VELHRLAPAEIDWAALDAFEDRVFSQRRYWLEFITSFAPREIVVAELCDLGRTIGYFSGIRSRIYGVPILGSPFRGWLTNDIGFNLAADVPYRDALRALERFAFKDLGCLQLEVADRDFEVADGADLGFRCRRYPSHVSDLTLTEEAMLARMSRSTRWSIRKAERNGLSVEIAAPEGFAEEFYAQFAEVFAKQGLRPPYALGRVRAMIARCHPSGDLLLARVRGPDGQSIATGIYLGYGKTSLFWGNGSRREHQKLRPNEALHWFAMRYWKARGVQLHDWGGADAYKDKYGCTIRVTPMLRKSRYEALEHAREGLIRLRNLPRRLKRRLYEKKIGQAPASAGERRQQQRDLRLPD
jgi:Acetyltransferase (GNAT) domain